MRRLWLATTLLLIPIPRAADTAAQAAAPRLLLILVVDQLRAVDIGLFDHRWRGGFRALVDQGAHFTRAEYPFMNTATCAGHSTISTGTLPKTHGMILNRWWHRAEQRHFNCMDDEMSPNVGYTRAATGGNSGKRMLVPTLADELRVQQPGARVVSLSLKPRSAIGLAGHGGDIVTWFDEPARSFVTSRAFAAEPVKSIRDFIKRDAPDADVGKVWALREPDDTYRHPDLGTSERPKAGWTALFPHLLVGVDGADAQFFDRWQKSPFSDEYLTRMAAAVSDDLQLGRGQATDYLAISFSALDSMGHDFGPNSREAEDLLMRLDASIGALLQRLDDTLGRDNYVVALTADHGTAPIPEQVGGGRIASEDVQQAVEQTLIARWGAPESAQYVPSVAPGAVYFGEGVIDRLHRDAAAFQAVVGAITSIPGVLRVLRPAELSSTSSDPLVRAAAAGYMPGRSGDLLLVPKRYWVFELRSAYDATNHGTFYDYDRRVPVLLRGKRIRPGRFGGSVSPGDIAPTLAHLAGLRLTTAEGRVLREAIR